MDRTGERRVSSWVKSPHHPTYISHTPLPHNILLSCPLLWITPPLNTNGPHPPLPHTGSLVLLHWVVVQWEVSVGICPSHVLNLATPSCPPLSLCPHMCLFFLFFSSPALLCPPTTHLSFPNLSYHPLVLLWWTGILPGLPQLLVQLSKHLARLHAHYYRNGSHTHRPRTVHGGQADGHMPCCHWALPFTQRTFTLALYCAAHKYPAYSSLQLTTNLCATRCGRCVVRGRCHAGYSAAARSWRWPAHRTVLTRRSANVYTT